MCCCCEVCLFAQLCVSGLLCGCCARARRTVGSHALTTLLYVRMLSSPMKLPLLRAGSESPTLVFLSVCVLVVCGWVVLVLVWCVLSLCCVVCVIISVCCGLSGR